MGKLSFKGIVELNNMNDDKTGFGFIAQVAYTYLTLPFLIFICGWVKIYFAIPIILVVLVSLFLSFNSSTPYRLPAPKKEDVPKIILIAIIALIWVYFTGLGGFAFQNPDFAYRNAIFKMLVEKPWPIVITDTAPVYDGPVAFVYYFAFWLPAALVGKLFGINAGIAFQMVWAVLGVMLIFYFISVFFKKISVWAVVIFVLFSGLDIIGMLMLSSSVNFQWLGAAQIENWAAGFQYSSHTTQLFWVFHQSIPAWLITLLMLNQKDSNRSLVFLFSLSLLWCTLPAIGLIPFFAYFAIKNCIKLWDKAKKLRENIINIVKESVTIQNLFGGGVIGITSFLFLSVNGAEKKLERLDMQHYFMSYLYFVFFEVLIYFILTYKAQKKRGIYYVALISLLVIPFFKVGLVIDFVMRTSIPALVILCLLVVDSLRKYKKEGKKLLCGLLLAALLFGAVTAQHEIMRTATSTIAAGVQKKSAVSPPVDILKGALRDNFFGKTEDSFFFKYIAK